MTATGRALLAEAIGTFFFLTLGVGSVLANEMTGGGFGLLGIAFANGLGLAVAVSIFGRVSGAHFNPAVTLGLALGGAFKWTRVLPYWIAQLVGAVATGFFIRLVFPDNIERATELGTPMLAAGIDAPIGTGVEAVLTFFLVLAVFGTVVSTRAPRVAGFGIGLTVAADILMGGSLTGAAMNPARYFGPAIVAGFFDNWWVYVVGPFAGGAIGGWVWRFVFSATDADAR